MNEERAREEGNDCFDTPQGDGCLASLGCGDSVQFTTCLPALPCLSLPPSFTHSLIRLPSLIHFPSFTRLLTPPLSVSLSPHSLFFPHSISLPVCYTFPSLPSSPLPHLFPASHLMASSIVLFSARWRLFTFIFGVVFLFFLVMSFFFSVFLCPLLASHNVLLFSFTVRWDAGDPRGAGIAARLSAG